MELYFLYGFILAVLLSYALTPLVRKLAFWFGAVDKPNERKVHVAPMPRMGGLAIYLAFSLSYGLVVIFTDAVATNVGYALLFGGGIVVITGMLDDRFELSAKMKLIGQILAASVAMYLGLRMQLITIPFTDTTVDIGYLGIPLTLLWILGVTNAINLIDGLDGLASGVSAIGAFALCVVSYMTGNTMIALMAFLLIGSILGFLRYNFFPAKIFMGDSGSLFLGFALSTMSLLELKQATLVSFVVPILILGIPITDTLYAMIRRKINRQPISSADKNHLHHRLLSLGFSHRNAVLVIYGISFAFALLAIFLSQSTLWLVFATVFVITILIEVLAEYVGLLNSKHQPLLSLLSKMARIFSGKSSN